VTETIEVVARFSVQSKRHGGQAARVSQIALMRNGQGIIYLAHLSPGSNGSRLDWFWLDSGGFNISGSYTRQSIDDGAVGIRAVQEQAWNADGCGQEVQIWRPTTTPVRALGGGPRVTKAARRSFTAA
jgi:hypothetical protein